MFETALGIWPGIAATLAMVLGVYIRLWPPEEKHNARWIMGFVFLGLTAIAATIMGQLVLYQQRQESQREDRERTNQVSEVKGKMDALLTLVPSLAKGNPEQTVSAIRQVSELQAQLSDLEEKTTGHGISPEQRAQLVELLRPCTATKFSLGVPVGNEKASRFAATLRAILNDAGLGDHLPSQNVFIETPRGIVFMVRNADSPPACTDELRKKLRDFGFDERMAPSQGLDPTQVEILIGMGTT